MDEKTVATIAKLFDLVNKTFSIESMAILLVLSLAFLKIPPSILAYFNITLPQEWMPYAGGLFIFSSVTLSVRGCFRLANISIKGIKNLVVISPYENIINTLTPDEISYLAQFFIPEQKEIVLFDEDCSIVLGLIVKRIIVKVAYGDISSRTPFKISERYKPYAAKLFSNVLNK